MKQLTNLFVTHNPLILVITESRITEEKLAMVEQQFPSSYNYAIFGGVVLIWANNVVQPVYGQMSDYDLGIHVQVQFKTINLPEAMAIPGTAPPPPPQIDEHDHGMEVMEEMEEYEESDWYSNAGLDDDPTIHDWNFGGIW
ncbi:uncharacterized protein [Spinacia oleracea]|uniref:Uncharacterized protein n=1 Tax=Spinacia oleracea TaxID=3562 RepID=A0A9R0HXT0_SPIOL|nr:uncharacterized protein LOC110778722 [Spinacia oleracea]